MLDNTGNCFGCDCFGYDRLGNMVGNIENMLGNIRNRFVCDRLIVRRQTAQLGGIINQFIKVVVQPLAAPVVPIIPMALARIIALAHVSSKSLTVALAEDVGSPLLRSLSTLSFVSRPLCSLSIIALALGRARSARRPSAGDPGSQLQWAARRARSLRPPAVRSPT